MKTKLTFFTLTGFLRIVMLSFLALSTSPCALGQIPQGFNYQAVARDPATGFSITGAPMKVQLTIQTDSFPSPGTILWKETHNVTTNSYGLFNIIIGKGTRVGGVASFNQVDWTAWPKYYIRNEIEYPLGSPPYKLLGVSRLWSVPFAMVAGEFDGPVKKLAVKGETTSNEEALFEVKNKDGQTVFAVYNEGVRVYVSDGAKAPKGGFSVGGFGTDKAGESTKYMFVDKDSVRIYLDTNPLTKKPKGGFSVGGYDLTKGVVVQDYLDVNSDSVRIYIDSNPSTKKLKGGFAVGGFDMVKGTSTNYMNVNPDSTNIIYPSQNRVYWYPLKNAFLTGRVLIEKPDSVGTNSFASGYESKAKGRYSQALGYKAIARGDYSTAIGKNALAGKIYSFALGESAAASNNESYAFGRGALARGYRSFSFGSAGIDSAGNNTSTTNARGDYSFAIGQGSLSTGFGSFTLGLADTASGSYSTSVGTENSSSGFGSLAIGYGAFAQGDKSISVGSSVNWMNPFTHLSGVERTASKAYRSIAIGHAVTASGSYSIAMGSGFQVLDLSLNKPYQTIASGKYSIALGSGLLSTSYHMFSCGRLNLDMGGNLSDWIDTDPLFVVGNGYWSKTSGIIRRNALTLLKNGNLGIGISSPSAKLHISGGDIRLEGGSITNLAGGVALGNASAGWYSDNTNLAARFPGASGDIYFQSSGPGTTYMRVGAGVAGLRLFSGNAIFDNSVGIGISSPSYKLHVNGNLYTTSIQIGNSSGSITPNWWEFGVDNGGGTGIDFHSNSTATDYSARIYRIPGNNGEFQIVNTGTGNLSFYTQNLVRMTINSSGYAGIGTTSPVYPLHIATAALANCPGYGYLNSVGSVGASSGSNYYSIFAENRIRAEEFNADSDIRIKRILGISNNEEDLKILKKIRITDFIYIDSIAKGNDVHKKVIAQDLKEVYPNAVSSASGFIPSIYARPYSVSFDIEKYQMVITMVKEHGLKPGDNVKFIETEGVFNEKVTMVISPLSFCISSIKERNKIFVYGKEVNDFLTVDYEAIAMLNVSVTQELISKSDAQQQQIDSQNQRIELLEKMILDMKGEIAASSR